MANLIERIAQSIDVGVTTAFGEKTTLDGVEVVPVALSWKGFGGGSDGGDEEAAGGGGGGGATIPVGIYVGDPTGPRFVPNTIAVLAVSIPLVWVIGKSLKTVIRALKK